MSFNHSHYVPCLRWKQGEYQAILRLSSTSKSNLTPLIEIPETRWDFEKQRTARTIDDHLAPFPERIRSKWDGRPCFVDLAHVHPSSRMASGAHPMSFVFDHLRKMKCPYTPVTGLARDQTYQREIAADLVQNECGLCLRVSVEQAAKTSVKTGIDSLLLEFEIAPENCDFILDLGAPPNFLPLDGFCRVVHAVVKRLPYLDKWRTFTLLGTSYPESIASIHVGEELVPRYEWQLYRSLIVSLHTEGLRLPAFGDYVIAHPKVMNLDMRRVKPASKIRYTVDDAWYVVKGRNVREDRFGKFEQYRELSKRIVNSHHYCGSIFSWGDDYIFKCAQGIGKTGNLTTWVQVDTNHHVEKVTRDVASFCGSLGTP